MKRKRDIEMWMLLVIVLLTACSDHSGEGSDENGDCFLNIYVYAPGRPMLTRADVGDIAHREAVESEIHTLQIWVFKHNGGSFVGYLETEPAFLNETNGQEMFQMKVEKEFADHPENVDVYVVANAESVGLTLGRDTKRDDLDAAMIGEGKFGVSSLVSSVPDQEGAEGLPMSGVKKDQPIYGSFPALRIGSQDKMTTVQLTRAVSKLRFVLCRIADGDSKELVSIDEIQLNGEMIPTESYLMPVANPSYTTIGYVSSPINYGSVVGNTIPTVEDPMKYAYETQAAQDYEDMINEAIAGTYKAAESDQPLKELGLTYLRESDKQLTGTIHYSVQSKGNEDENQVDHTPSVTFSMASPGDFYRNRSWIIYVFYMDAKIHVLTVTDMGVKSWTSDNINDDKSVYNW
jgi:hypothetical protein